MTTPYYSMFSGAQVDEAVGRSLVTFSGTRDIALGVAEGAVTGLGLSFVPTEIFLQIEAPDDSDALVFFAVPIKGSVSNDGFSFYLSGETDSPNYRIHYLILGDGNLESIP